MTDLSALTQYAVVAFASLFILVDPLATAPLFIAMTEGDPPDKRRDHRYVQSRLYHPGTRDAGNRLLRTNGLALPVTHAGVAARCHCRPIYLATHVQGA